MEEDETQLAEQIHEAVGKIRIDEYHPWRYLFFVFLAGIARGIGFALGLTVVLAVVVFILTKVLSSLVNFPLVGSYFKEFADLMQYYLKSGVKLK